MVINRKGRRGIAQRPQRKIRLRPLRISLRSLRLIPYLHPKIFFKLLTTFWLYFNSFIRQSAGWNSHV
jgi:hypothetical protein